MAGRKPHPTALKLLKGEKKKNRLNEGEPKPTVGIPDCPSHLSEDAKAEWERVSPILANMGVLTLADMGVLAAYCDAWGRWIEASALIKKHGIIIVGRKTGMPYCNPAIGLMHRAKKDLVQFGAELGLTPAGRTKIKVTPRAELPDNEMKAL